MASDLVELKLCRGCGQSKPLDEFYRSRHYGWQARCKTCQNKQNAAWALAHPEIVRAIGRAWATRNYRENRDGVLATRKREHPWRKYRLTRAARSALFEESDGLCALCYDNPATVIDHDHETGLVRGALCKRCNIGLGYFRDNPELLQQAIDYLHGV